MSKDYDCINEKLLRKHAKDCVNSMLRDGDWAIAEAFTVGRVGEFQIQLTVTRDDDELISDENDYTRELAEAS